jgi:WD40-like Beta Propeller Repeat
MRTEVRDMTPRVRVSLSTLGLNDRKVTPFGDVHTSSPPGAVFSPDGRWVAYASTERGKTTTYVQPFSATGAKYQFVASNLADSPEHARWSSDGKELFLNTSATEFVGVSVTTQPTFAFGNPVALSKALRGGPELGRRAEGESPDEIALGSSSSCQAAAPCHLSWRASSARAPERMLCMPYFPFVAGIFEHSILRVPCEGNGSHAETSDLYRRVSGTGCTLHPVYDLRRLHES